jgi:large subunit ribosomal protein L18
MALKGSQKDNSRDRRRKHFSKKFISTPGTLRLVVHRSNKHIYAQLVDDAKNKTIASASTKTKAVASAIADTKKVEQAKAVGKHIAELVGKKKYDKIVFDRAGYLYHGRVKALAEGAREGGLKF